MIFRETPQSFEPKFEVVSCFCEVDDEILVLHRQDHKPEGNSWGLPAGKRNAGESEIETVIREVFEETGKKIDVEQLEFIERLFVRYPDLDFIFSMYSARFPDKFEVILNPNEHKDFHWIKPVEFYNLKLVQDMEPCVDIYIDKRAGTI